MNVFIHGSCVTRDAFEFDADDNFKIEHYSARSSLATLALPPILECLDLSKLQSNFQRKMLKDDHDRAVIEYLSSKNYDIVILDFIDERGGLVNLDNNGFVTNLNELRESGVIDRAASVEYIKEYSLDHKVLFLKGFDKFISSVKDNTPVFINKVFWATQNELGELVASNSKYIYEANRFLTDIYEILETKYPDVNFIEYSESLFIANSNHKWGQSPFHYIDELYYGLLNYLNDENIKMNNTMSNNYFYDLNTWNYPVCDYFVHKIEDVDISGWFESDGIHRIFLNSSLSIDFCVIGSKFYADAKTCLVCFSGAITGERSSKPAPIFSGFTVSNDVQLPLISISDPTMALSKDISLGWYAGNHEIPNLLSIIAKLLDNIGLEIERKLTLFGGSGGGFASLATAQLMEKPANVCVANPQTSIAKYAYEHVEKYLNIGYRIDYSKFSKEFLKNDLNFAIDQYIQYHDLSRCKFNNNTRVIYLQNLSDWHTEIHAIPFLKQYNMISTGNSVFISHSGNIGFYVGDWGEGHAAIPKEILNRILMMLNSDSDVQTVLDYLDIIKDVHVSGSVRKELSDYSIVMDGVTSDQYIDVNIDEEIIISRGDSSVTKNASIQLEIAGSSSVDNRELLYSINYFGDVSDEEIVKLGYAKSSYSDIGYFKYIPVMPNAISKITIDLTFPPNVSRLAIRIKRFYPKGKTFILSSKILVN